MANYNATVVANKFDSISLVEVDASGLIIRCAGMVNHLSGTPEFDAVFRADWLNADGFTVIADGGAKYRQQLRSMGLR